MSNPTQKILHELFKYKDGQLYWKTFRANNKVKPGDVAGILHKKSGYYRICIDNERYKLHTMVFLYHHGYIPEMIDHHDTNKLNNRIDNLRPATKSNNNCNQNKRKDNSSGIKGISLYPELKCVHAQLQVNKKKYHKHFYPISENNIILAKQWIVDMRNNLHGEFARHD